MSRSWRRGVPLAILIKMLPSGNKLNTWSVLGSRNRLWLAKFIAEKNYCIIVIIMYIRTWTIHTYIWDLNLEGETNGFTRYLPLSLVSPLSSPFLFPLYLSLSPLFFPLPLFLSRAQPILFERVAEIFTVTRLLQVYNKTNNNNCHENSKIRICITILYNIL